WLRAPARTPPPASAAAAAAPARPPASKRLIPEPPGLATRQGRPLVATSGRPCGAFIDMTGTWGTARTEVGRGKTPAVDVPVRADASRPGAGLRRGGRPRAAAAHAAPPTAPSPPRRSDAPPVTAPNPSPPSSAPHRPPA